MYCATNSRRMKSNWNAPSQAKTELSKKAHTHTHTHTRAQAQREREEERVVTTIASIITK